jgi:hypothetical protein
MTTSQSPVEPPEFSVIIGLVSTEDGDRILETLAKLRLQAPKHTYEVILADRRGDAISQRISDEFPEARIVSAPPDTDLPTLRTMALMQSVGRYVVVTEDHCVPPVEWLDGFSRVFAAGSDKLVAVGGCVKNGVTDRPLDWATFLCEYSFFLPPVDEGESTILPGMNVAYHRDALLDIDPAQLRAGFWETTVHGDLLKKGLKLHSSNELAIFHCKKFSRRLFCRQRFVYSRYFAALRFKKHEVVRRTAAFVLTPVLPSLLLYRMVRQCRNKDIPAGALISALPNLVVFVFIWAVGEMVGYALGSGSALREIE